MTPIATWLNEAFSGFDYAILHALHMMGEGTNYLATYFWKFITYFAEDGIGMLVFSALMIGLGFTPFVRKKWGIEAGKNLTKCGLVALLGIGFGALITNLTVKPLIARPRPYIDVTSIYHEWWLKAGALTDPETSFPSGHTTATMATMTSIFIHGKKNKSWTAFIFVILMGLSRNYLCMHYPSDILGGIVVGGVACTLSFLFWTGIFKLIDKRKKAVV